MRPLVPLIGVLSLLWIVGGSWYIANSFCPASNAAVTEGFTVSDGGFMASSTGTYHFGISNSKMLATKEAYTVLEKTAAYLKAHPEKALLLTGVYGSSEKNNTEFANLGVARAESMKSSLVKRGAIADNISTAGLEKENLAFVERKIYNNIDFEFSKNPALSNASTSMNKGGVGADNNMVVYFKGEESNVDADDPTITEIITHLEKYISENPKAKILVSGHTDNQGDRVEKREIARARAAKVRRVIRDYGNGKVFKSRQVIAKVVGPDDPIADNDTEDGRKLNNRVTIQVEK